MKKNDFIETGIEKLDSEIGGLRKGEVTVIASKPSDGKSFILQKLAAHICINEKEKGVYYTIDRSKDNLLREFTEKHDCKLSDDYENTLKIIDVADIYIDALIKNIEEQKPSIVFIDSLILIKIEYDKPSFEMYQEVMKKLKIAARKTNCAIIVTVSCVNTEDVTPSLNSVRGSAVVDIADLILIVNRNQKIFIAKNNH